MKWFSRVGFPWNYIIVGVLVLALVASIVLGVKSCKQIDQDNDNRLVNAGEVIEREASHAEVINHVEEARDAVDNPTSNDLNRVCSRYDRNCKNGQ